MTKETKLTEPVQVGLWYETKAGEKVFMEEHKNPSKQYAFQGSNGFSYTRKGELYDDDISGHDLIRCLGADPFKSDKERDLLEMLHYTEHKLPKPTEMCERFAYITVVQHKDGTFGHSYGGMMPSAVAAKVITGADPFNQVCSETDMSGLLSNLKPQTQTPTLHDQVAMSALQGLLANPNKGGGVSEICSLSNVIAAEFVRQKTEREQTK